MIAGIKQMRKKNEVSREKSRYQKSEESGWFSCEEKREKIDKKALELFEKRGGSLGSYYNYWLEAEDFIEKNDRRSQSETDQSRYKIIQEMT